MREWLLRTFFPGVVIRRLEQEAAEKRIADLEAEVAALKARPTPQPLIINNPPPIIGYQPQTWPNWIDTTIPPGTTFTCNTANTATLGGAFKFLNNEPDLYDDDDGAAVAQ